MFGIRKRLEGASAPPPPGLEARVDRLEDRYNHLWRRFERLQGEFNALYAYDDDEEELEDELQRRRDAVG